jgi:hypothetical protein
VIVDTMKLISRLTLRVEWDVQDLGEEEGARKKTLKVEARVVVKLYGERW